MNMQAYIRGFGTRALAASRKLAVLSKKERVAIVRAMADELVAQHDAILAANRLDVADAQAAGMAPALVDRLTLTEKRFQAMVDGVRTVAQLTDPVGKVLKRIRRPNGLRIEKVRVPLGVIAIIFESRPNVTADVASLCVKTANAVILRGGKEAPSRRR